MGTVKAGKLGDATRDMMLFKDTRATKEKPLQESNGRAAILVTIFNVQ
jgi:hypothetical protein